MSDNILQQQKEKAFIEVEDMFMVELQQAKCRDDVHDLLYAELGRVITQHDLYFITPDKVLPEFWDVYGLKD